MTPEQEEELSKKLPETIAWLEAQGYSVDNPVFPPPHSPTQENKSMKKLPHWELGQLGNREPSGWLVVKNANEHSHWSLAGEWLYVCGGDCVKRSKEHHEAFTLITKERFTYMNKLTSWAKRVLNEDEQALYKAGLIDGDFTPTELGRDELDAILWAEKKEILVKRAKEIIADEEKSSR